MAQVVDLPLEDGGMLLVQSAAADEPSGGFGLASSAEEKVKKAGETLESALAHITPARQAVAGKFLPGGNYSFLGTDQPAWFAERLVACPPVPSAQVLAPTVYGSPTAGSMATGSSQADARRWVSRHGPGPGVSASSSQTGTFA